MSVGVDELLAEEDGLAGGELLGDDVGLTDLVGFGLPLGLGSPAAGFTVRLGVGAAVDRWPWLA